MIGESPARSVFLAVLAALTIFSLTLALRISNLKLSFADDHALIPPFDDLYHLKRIVFSAQNFPRFLEFDSQRGIAGAYCPWPPLYDLAAGGVTRLVMGKEPSAIADLVVFFPPLISSFFAATASFWVARKKDILAALLTGVSLALSPSLDQVARIAQIDHHFLEPPLALLLAWAVWMGLEATDSGKALRAGLALFGALSACLFVQIALLPAAAVSLGILVFPRKQQEFSALAAALGFGGSGMLILGYGLSRPESYPQSFWFLGSPHAATLLGAAVASFLIALGSRQAKGSLSMPRTLFYMGIGAACFVAFPGAFSSFVESLSFFHGDPWLDQVEEFFPLFSPARRTIPGGLVLLGGGVFLLPVLLFLAGKRFRPADVVLATMTLYFTAASLTRERFVFVAAAFTALCGVRVWQEFREKRKPAWALLCAGLILLPSLPSAFSTLISPGEPPVPHFAQPVLRAARFLREHSKPSARVLTVETWGHVVNVIGGRPSLVDGFGSSLGTFEFQESLGMLLANREEFLVEACRKRGVRYLLLVNPLFLLPGTAQAMGLEFSAYLAYDTHGTPRVTRLTQSTIWWRAYMERGAAHPERGAWGHALRRLRLVYEDSQLSWEPPPFQRSAAQVWEVLY